MNIAGDPTLFPAELPLLDDGTPPDGAEINVPVEALTHRTAYLLARLEALVTPPVDYTAAGPTVLVAGPYDKYYRLRGCGGGGGGAAGGAGGTTADSYSCGGGGGGGALLNDVVVEVTPGETYEILVGVGGTAGSEGGGTPTDGGDGGDTIFRVQGGAVLARFKGGAGGKAPSQNFTSDPAVFVIAPGGSSVVGDFFRPAHITNSSTDVNAYTTYCTAPSFGGEGIDGRMFDASNESNRNGAPSPQGVSGGSGGIPGTDAGSQRGGGPGGGGGAGPFAAGVFAGGGIGGSGGAGHANNGLVGEDAGTPGGVGLSLGAGGGGGGGGGSGAITGGAGGNGSVGNSGKLTLYVVGAI